MITKYRLPRRIIDETFSLFRECGKGQRECQALWLSPWSSPAAITEVVHPEHYADIGGFVLNDRWLSAFWLRLARDNLGVRVQIHTHPFEAFHSTIDDTYPIIHTPQFLSLVIPNFALGPAGFRESYLAELQADGHWRQVSVADRLSIE